jgi:hypothetical protein
MAQERQMGDDEDQRLFDALIDILDACEGSTLSLEEQLRALSIVWTQRAQQLRSDALAIPGAFPQERARQVALAQEMTAAILRDEPDLEMERLQLEGDVRGAADYFRRKIERRDL